MITLLAALKFWPWALVVLAVLAVIGAAMNPIAAAKLARELGGFVIERARGAITWLRDPRRNWWRISCLALGFGFMLASGVAWDQRREVLVVTERCSLQLAEERAETESAKLTAGDNARAVQTCRATLAREVGKAADVQRLAREAVDKAREDAKTAQRDLAAWERDYASRPPTCEAALRALEDACPTITDY